MTFNIKRSNMMGIPKRKNKHVVTWLIGIKRETLWKRWIDAIEEDWDGSNTRRKISCKDVGACHGLSAGCR